MKYSRILLPILTISAAFAYAKSADTTCPQKHESVTKATKQSGKVVAFKKGDTVDQLITQYPLVIIDFHAVWCNPCHRLKPHLEKIVKEHPEVTVITIDIDQHPSVKNKFGINSIPTLVFYKNGTYVTRTQGSKSYNELNALVTKHLIS